MKRQLLDDVIRLMYDPEEWVFDSYTAKHRPTGIKIWLSDYWWLYHVYKPSEIYFSWLGTWKLYRAVQDLKHRKINQTIYDYEWDQHMKRNTP